MQDIKFLNTENLSLLPNEVKIPDYNRSKIQTGIVHIGVGGFFRAHCAFYTDKVLHKNTTNWGICGMGLLPNDRKIIDTLNRQDGLYTLMSTQSDGVLSARVIGSMIDFVFAPENPQIAIKKMADPAVKIITLTITEGGYNFNEATKEFQIEDPTIQWDLNNPQHPKTVFGYLTQALKKRRDNNIPGLTLQSCDNIQKNGAVLKKMLLSFVKKAQPDLIDWINQNVTFPNSMVDRITPVTKPSDIKKLKSEFEIDDGWPVVCEPFIQWIIEDDFANGRPEWESVGAQFVQDVGPYEKMKIRLLNAGHSLLGFLGTLYGCKTIDETIELPMFRSFLREFMDKEVTPVLGNIKGINIEAYKDTLIQRFGNKYIKDELSRICLESSAKIPTFLLPTIKEQLVNGGSIHRGTLVVAAWCRYLEVAGTPGYNYTIDDKMATTLQTEARASMSNDPMAFLKIRPIFGDLVNSKQFVETYLHLIDTIRRSGIKKTIEELQMSQ